MFQLLVPKKIIFSHQFHLEFQDKIMEPIFNVDCCWRIWHTRKGEGDVMYSVLRYHYKGMISPKHLVMLCVHFIDFFSDYLRIYWYSSPRCLITKHHLSNEIQQMTSCTLVNEFSIDNTVYLSDS